MADDYNGARNAPNSEETVSLVDLLAVLLRHRRLIIISNLFAILLAVVAYMAFPTYKQAKAERERIVEANMLVMCSNAFEGILNQIDGSNFIMQSLRDPANILMAMQTAGYEELEKTDIRPSADINKALFVVRRRLIDNKSLDGNLLKESSRRFLVILDKGVVSILFKNGDSAKAEKFLETLISIVNQDLHAFILPNAKNRIESFERLLLIEKPSEVVGMSIVEGSQGYAIAKSVIDGKMSPLVILRPAYALIPEISRQAIRKDTLKKCVVAVFAVFFLSVFAAFVLQYIETVRKDPDAMGKIRDALGKKKE